MTTTEAEPTDDISTEPPERLCDVCGEPGATDDLPKHGECILREAFGGVATIIVPDDVEAGITDADGGLTCRQSGFGIELLIDRSTADQVLRADVVSDMELDERRKVLAYVKAVITDDLDELEKVAPQAAREMRLKRALKEVVGALLG